jgi:putative FmdB family regulatory protein
MPIYEYTCQKCGAHMEVMQKISDKPLSRHARCGGKLAKEWSQTSFQLKGSGWYVTDYAGKKSEPKAEASESKKETKKEAKSEAAAPASSDAKEPKGKKASAAAGE